MKKILAILLVFALFAALAAIPAYAAPGERSYGQAKKVNDGDIDMGKAEMTEPAWANTAKVNINHLNDGEAFGDVYLLWSDTALYAFFDITDITPDAKDNGRAQENAPWEEDSVEWFIDITNKGEHCEQFRVDRFGVPSYYPHQGAWMDDFCIGATKMSDCEPVPPGHMSWAVKVDGNKYYVKMKITFFGKISAGDVGMNFQINNYGGTPVWPTGYEGSSWTPDVYGVVTLVNEMAYTPPAAGGDTAAAGGSGNFVFIEAESGKNNGMQVADDSGAYNGKCIVSQDAENTIEYNIDIANPGKYVIWARVYAEQTADNSYLYSFNGNTFNGTDLWIFDFYELNEQPTPNDRFFDPKLQSDELYFTWYWLRMNYRDTSVDPAAWWNMQFFDMKAGANTLLLKTREVGAKIDKFIVTDDLDYDPKTISGDPEIPYLAKLAEEAAAAAAAEAEREAAANANQPAPTEAAPPPTPSVPPTGDGFAVLVSVVLAAGAFVFARRFGRARQF